MSQVQILEVPRAWTLAFFSFKILLSLYSRFFIEKKESSSLLSFQNVEVPVVKNVKCKKLETDDPTETGSLIELAQSGGT